MVGGKRDLVVTLKLVVECAHLASEFAGGVLDDAIGLVRLNG